MSQKTSEFEPAIRRLERQAAESIDEDTGLLTVVREFDLSEVEVYEPARSSGTLATVMNRWCGHSTVRNSPVSQSKSFTSTLPTPSVPARSASIPTSSLRTRAKGIANGMPLGAFTATEEVADAFESGDHLSTFGGNPVTCAAALATIDELQDGIVDNAVEQSEYLDDAFADIESDYDVIGEARGLGLMRGVEFVDPEASGPKDHAPAPDDELAKRVGRNLREQGIVMGIGGFYKNVMRVQPPLSISREQLEMGVEGLKTAIETERTESPPRISPQPTLFGRST
jgi:hypothetical protein